jgi:hypothetical protein
MPNKLCLFFRQLDQWALHRRKLDFDSPCACSCTLRAPRPWTTLITASLNSNLSAIRCLFQSRTWLPRFGTCRLPIHRRCVVTTRVTFEGEPYGLVQRFHFDNEQKTQSSIAEDKHQQKSVFVKGSPGALVSLGLDFMIPKNCRALVTTAEKFPFYQLAVGFEGLPSESR